MPRDPGEAAGLSRHAADLGADVVEIRGDLLESFPLKKLARGLSLPAVFTLRPSSEGGLFEGGEKDRLRLLRRASSAGFAWVDVEHESGARPASFGCPVILSRHDFAGMGGDLKALSAGMAAAGAHAVKIAVTPRSARDVVSILGLQRNPPCRASIFGLGRMGFATRLTGLASGAFMTYAALSPEGATAPLQPLLSDLAGIYRARSVRPGTPIYGVAGNPALHSLGPAVHNALFEKHGIPGLYVPFEIDDLAPLAEAAPGLGIRGLSVTMPFKTRAAGLAQRLSASASAAGAANTLTFTGGAIEADNTDSRAVVEALESVKGSVAGLRVLVIGAGGAGRAAAFGLTGAGAEVTITNRSRDRGRDLARESGASFVTISEADLSRYDAVVQATPVGMGDLEGREPLPGRRMRAGAAAVEMIYNPPRTAFLAAAGEAGAVIADGMAVFARQAAAQFEAWTGIRPEEGEVMAIIERRQAS